MSRSYQARLKQDRPDPELWPEYVRRSTAELAKRPPLERFRTHIAGLAHVCFLCAEATAERCHRRLLAEHIAEHAGSPIEIMHL